LSSNGQAQVTEVRNLILQNEETLATLKQDELVVAHSPMLRAKLTCEGLFKDLTHPSIEFIELDLLREIVPVDYVAPTRWANAQNRIADFERWVAERKEENIVIVGHSHYFKSMLGIDFKFANCDVWKVEFISEGSDPKERWSNLTRVCGSCSAKPTFGAEGPEAWSNKNNNSNGSSNSPTNSSDSRSEKD
jgi:broad specificity phosphatase PhoE